MTTKNKKNYVVIRGLKLNFPKNAVTKNEVTNRIGRAIEKHGDSDLFQHFDKIRAEYITAIRSRGLYIKGARRQYDYEMHFDEGEQTILNNLLQKAVEAGEVNASDFGSTQGKYTPAAVTIIIPRSKEDSTLVRVSAYVMLGVPTLYTQRCKSDPKQAQNLKEKLDHLPEVE